MKNKHLTLCMSIASALAVLPVMTMAAPLAGINTTEMPRVTQTIDSKVVTTLANTHTPAVNHLALVGSLADSTPMEHMQLVLKQSALRASALETLVASQHEPHSPQFHHWVTPTQFGEKFGVAPADIEAAKSWLVSQGFTVHGVYPNRLQIDFSGNAGLVKRAFHTQMNRYSLNKVNHIANAGDISVPSALRDVVAGVVGLNNARPQPLIKAPKLAQYDPASHLFKVQKPADLAAKSAASPDAVNFTNGSRGLVPYDMAKIYAVDSLRASGITGKGITIALIEDASMAPADWTNFVSQFNLGSYLGTYKQFQPQATGFANCIDPGTPVATTDPESLETVLDAEWATAIAPGANIEVASCSDSDTTNSFGGVFIAATNLINGTTIPDVISGSYGYGENAGLITPADKKQFDLMWAQADAEGISVFISSGDSSSNPSFNGSIINGNGIDANGFGTSPNDTVVGGTDTADVLLGTSSKYFSKTVNSEYGSALSYVPEITWNESCGNTAAARSLGFATALDFCKQYSKLDPQGVYVTSEGGSGGPSSIDRKPAWQRQVYGAAKDQSRDVPDVSLFGGSYGNSTLVVLCTLANPCAPGFTTPVQLEAGTSLSSPMFAGIQALIDQSLVKKGFAADQGNAAPTLYALAAQEYGGATGTPPASLAACNASNGTSGTSKCVFHNVTDGGNASQCVEGVAGQDSASIFGTSTSNCYFYATYPNFTVLEFGIFRVPVGPVKVGLTSTSSTKYAPAYAAQAGWSFANGLGSVNAKNLASAWLGFVAGQ